MLHVRSAMTMSPNCGGIFDMFLRLVRFGLGGDAGDSRRMGTKIGLEARDLTKQWRSVRSKQLRGQLSFLRRLQFRKLLDVSTKLICRRIRSAYLSRVHKLSGFVMHPANNLNELILR